MENGEEEERETERKRETNRGGKRKRESAADDDQEVEGGGGGGRGERHWGSEFFYWNAFLSASLPAFSLPLCFQSQSLPSRGIANIVAAILRELVRACSSS